MSNLLVLASDPAEIAHIVEEVRNEVRYIVTDFSLELIASKFRDEAEAEGDIYVPNYQRSLAWSDIQGSYFIESLILRIPVPPLFLYDVDGRLEIVDGSQRVRSLVRFINGDYALVGLEKLEVLNGYHYADLPPSVQRRLNNTPIRSFVMDQGTDESTRIELFRRLNTSGKRLEDAEIRKGIYQGPFLDLVIDRSSSEIFKSITPHMAKGVDTKSERQELVTRFFIYSDFYMEFRHDVRKFLDEEMDQFNTSLSTSRLKSMRREFDGAMEFIKAHYPNAFYRSDGGRRVPRVRFEAVAVGTNLALRVKPKLECKNISWLRTPEFEDLSVPMQAIAHRNCGRELSTSATTSSGLAVSVEAEFVGRTKEVTGYLRSLKSLEKAHNTPGRGFYRATAAVTASRAASFIMMYNCIEFGVREATIALRRDIISQCQSFGELRDYWKEEITRAHFQQRLVQGTNHIRLLQDVTRFMPGSVSWKGELDRLPFAGNVDHLEILQFIRRIEHRWRPPPSSLGGADLYLIRQMRNDLAHGNDTFENVGSNFQTDDLIEKFQRARKFVVSLIRALEGYRRKAKYKNHENQLQ